MEHNANAVAAGRVAGVDPIEEITTRCIRIVKTMEVEVGGCALCRYISSFGGALFFTFCTSIFVTYLVFIS